VFSERNRGNSVKIPQERKPAISTSLYPRLGEGGDGRLGICGLNSIRGKVIRDGEARQIELSGKGPWGKVVLMFKRELTGVVEDGLYGKSDRG